jgi:hypothetical protein
LSEENDGITGKLVMAGFSMAFITDKAINMVYAAST